MEKESKMASLANANRRFGFEEVAFKCQCHQTLKLEDCTCPVVIENMIVESTPHLHLSVVVKDNMVFIKNPNLNYENCLPLNQGKRLVL